MLIKSGRFLFGLILLFSSLNTVAAVKLSRSGICHDTYSEYYHQVKHFTSYDTKAELIRPCMIGRRGRTG